jgi:hypothetical protein
MRTSQIPPNTLFLGGSAERDCRWDLAMPCSMRAWNPILIVARQQVLVDVNVE